MTAYGTPAGFKAYHKARGRFDADNFDNTDSVAPALLVASEWVDGRYRSKFSGTKVGMRDQEREYPRNSSFDVYGYNIPSNIVPNEILNSVYEAAYKEIITPGSLSKDWTPAKYKSVQVNGAVSVTYAEFNSVQDLQTRFAIVEQIIAPILTGGGAISSLSGPASRV